MRAFAVLSVLLILGWSVCVMAQQPYDPSLYSGLHWRNVGPFRGGRVNGVTGVPGQPNTFFFGSVGGGLLEVYELGSDVAAGVRLTAGRIDRRGGSLAFEPEHRLRRHWRSRHALADLIRQWNVQVYGLGSDVDASGSGQHSADRTRAGGSEKREHGVCSGVGT